MTHVDLSSSEDWLSFYMAGKENLGANPNSAQKRALRTISDAICSMRNFLGIKTTQLPIPCRLRPSLLQRCHRRAPLEWHTQANQIQNQHTNTPAVDSTSVLQQRTKNIRLTTHQSEGTCCISRTVCHISVGASPG